MNIGFIGLGNIGFPLARCAIGSARHRVAVHDLDRARARPLLEAGARWAPDPAALAREVDVVLTSLPGPPEVRAVIEGAGGVLEGIRPGSTWIELSTTDRTQLLRFAERFAEKGCATLDCPVTGGVPAAHRGEATLFVSGERGVYETARPVLESMAARVLYLGALGNAMTCKLITNLLVFAHQAILGEGLMIGKLAGLDLAALGEAINTSFGASVVSEKHIGDIYDGSYDSRFPLALALKDLDLVSERAHEVGAPLYVGALVRERFRQAAERYGAEQWDLMNLKLLEDETGTLLRP